MLQVNKAGDGIVVIIHLFKNGIPMCSLLNDHFQRLAQKFRTVKFLKGQAQSCMPNFPDAHLPCVMIYRDGKAEKKYVGPDFWGNRPSLDVVEWLLGKFGQWMRARFGTQALTTSEFSYSAREYPHLLQIFLETNIYILPRFPAKKAKAFVTDIEQDPRPKTRDVLMRQLKGGDYSDDSDD